MPDLFGANRPSVSFKNAPFGATYDLIVESDPSLAQSRDFESGELDTWPDGNAKMAVVIDVRVSGTGEERALWVAKPSSMFAAIGAAQKAAGAIIEIGGRLQIRYVSDIENKNPRLNPAKQYAAHYTPPAPQPAENPWGATAPAAVPQQAAPAPAPAPAPAWATAPAAVPQQAAPAPAPAPAATGNPWNAAPVGDDQPPF